MLYTGLQSKLQAGQTKDKHPKRHSELDSEFLEVVPIAGGIVGQARNDVVCWKRTLSTDMPPCYAGIKKGRRKLTAL